MQTLSDYSFRHRYEVLEGAYLGRCGAILASVREKHRQDFYGASMTARQNCLHHGTRADKAKSFEQHLLRALLHPEWVVDVVLDGRIRSDVERTERATLRKQELQFQIAKAELALIDLPVKLERLKKTLAKLEAAPAVQLVTPRATKEPADPCSRDFSPEINPLEYDSTATDAQLRS